MKQRPPHSRRPALLTWHAWHNVGHTTGLWFRVRGRGFYIAWRNKSYRPLFSERNGYRRVLKIGRLAIMTLRDDPAWRGYDTDQLLETI